MTLPTTGSSQPHDFQADMDIIARIDAVPTILDVVCRTTGMGFAAVARVTEDRWVACQVRDHIAFGLEPGGELKVETTICHEIREKRTAVVINHVAEDAAYCGHPTPAQYGFQSYISMPIVLPDGTFFGTLCAIDPKPAQLDRPEVVGTFKMFADLIGFQIDAHMRTASAEDAMRSEAFIRSVLAASPDCVKVLSADGRLEFMNERGVELNQLGSLSDVLGQEFQALWPEAERSKIRDAIHRAAAGEIARTEGFCPTAEGEPRWWEASFAAFQPEGIPDLKLVGISRDITVRVRAQQAEEQSRTRLETAIKVANLGTFDWNTLTGAVYADTRSREIFGLAVEGELREDDIFGCIAPEEIERVQAETSAAVSSGKARAIEYDILRADGTRRSISSSGALVVDCQGEPHMVGVFSDVTDLKRGEALLRREKLDLEQAVEVRTAERDRMWALSQEVLVVARADGTLEAVNARWTELLGWSEADLIGSNFAHYTHPDDLEATLAAFASILERSLVVPYEYRFRHKDGTYRWFSWTGAFADGRIYASGRDITVRRKQAEALRLTQTRAAAYFNFSEDYLFLIRVGADGIACFEDMNPACEQVMGLVRADLIGRPVDACLPPDSARDISHYARFCLETGQAQKYDAPRMYREGRQVLIEGRVAFVERSGDGGGTVLFSGHDITEQRTIEEALRQSQKMEAVGQLTGGLAHDFNNLLTGVTGSLELLQTRIAQGRIKDVDRYVNAAQGAAKRAAALTHRLLAFSRRQTLDPKPTNMNRLVLGMEEMIRRTVGPEIDVESMVAAAGLWPTLVDPGQLENALLNLCINARDAMPDGGKLTIETGNRWLDERTARERDLSPGQYVSLCVSDTGTGMPPEVIAKAFDPFFTTKPIGQGTGLGLSMIYGFTKQSGGQARIYSEVGQGTMVCIYLPRHLGEAETAELVPELADAPRGEAGQTVLVVDDEPTVRMLVTEVLEDLGYHAIEAADGTAGLQVLQSDVRIDLLVTDVGLPGGMNGRQVADAARIVRPSLKVLFITGYAENAVLSHGHLDPGMHVLTKPFAMEALASRIKELISI